VVKATGKGRCCLAPHVAGAELGQNHRVGVNASRRHRWDPALSTLLTSNIGEGSARIHCEPVFVTFGIRHAPGAGYRRYDRLPPLRAGSFRSPCRDDAPLGGHRIVEALRAPLGRLMSRSPVLRTVV